MNIQAQEWLLRRLMHFGADIYEGRFASLRDRLKHAIEIHGMERVAVGQRDGRTITYRQAWEMTYEAKFGEA